MDQEPLVREWIDAAKKFLDELVRPPAPDWLEQVIGSFKDEPAFDEVVAYGRAIRKGELSVEDIDP